MASSDRRGGAGRSGGRSKDRGSGGGGGRKGGRGGRPADPRQAEAARLARSLEKVLERIPETQAAVLRWRMGLEDGQPHSTADTARQLGLSLAETREIEARAFEHIREAVPVEHLQRYLQA
jgi:DNA-directed RNA polymerase sigma subunit (sigma70/sigma32)